MNINHTKVVQVDVKTLSISGKVCDAGIYQLLDQDEELIHEHVGYVPYFLGGGGDYLEFDIDLETGQILNWNPPTARQIEDWIKE